MSVLQTSLQALGATAGALLPTIFFYYELRGRYRRRATLKMDLEILGNLKTAELDYQLVKDRVDAAVKHIYSPATSPPRRKWIPLFSVGAAITGASVYWTVVLVH